MGEIRRERIIEWSRQCGNKDGERTVWEACWERCQKAEVCNCRVVFFPALARSHYSSYAFVWQWHTALCIWKKVESGTLRWTKRASTHSHSSECSFMAFHLLVVVQYFAKAYAGPLPTSLSKSVLQVIHLITLLLVWLTWGVLFS